MSITKQRLRHKVHAPNRRASTTLGTCVACGEHLRELAAVAVGDFRLMACRRCDGWTSWPRPSSEEQAALHNADAYGEHPYLVHRRANTRALERRCAMILDRIGGVVDAAGLRGERILDVGCDTGQFVIAAAKRLGAVPVGVDVASSAVAMATEAGVYALCTTVDEAPAALRDFRLVTAVDLIEHVTEPVRFFKSIQERLHRDGVIYVETPNPRSFIYRVGRVLCALTRGHPQKVFSRLFPREHVQYFTPEGLRAVAESSGLELVAIDSRTLPSGEIAVGALTRLGLFVLQGFDHLTGQKALLWAILRRRNPRAEVRA